MSTSHPHAHRSDAVLLTLSFCLGIVIMSIRAGFSVLYPAIASDLGLTAAEATGAFAMSMPVYAVAVIGAGILLDRIGIKATMLGALVAEILGLGLGALSVDLVQLYLTWGLLVGIGASGVGYVANLKMVAVVAPHLVGRGLGMLSAGQGVGALLVTPAIQLMVEQFGWRVAQGAMATGIVILLLPLILWAAPGRGGGGVSNAEDEGMLAVIKAQPRAFSWAMLALFSMGFTLLLPTHQVAYLTDVGAPGIVAATVGGVMGGMWSVGGLAGGFLTARIGAPRLLLIGGIMTAIGPIALSVASPEAPFMVLLYLIGAGIGRGMTTVGLGTIQARVFPGHSLGRISGLLEIGFGLGGFAGPWATAAIRDSAGTYVPGILMAAPAALLLAFGGLACWQSRAEREKTPA